MRAVVLALGCALAASSCAGPQKPPCTQESLNALRALYERAASQVISAGECDDRQHVEDCAPYRLVELHFEAAMRGMCSK